MKKIVIITVCTLAVLFGGMILYLYINNIQDEKGASQYISCSITKYESSNLFSSDYENSFYFLQRDAGMTAEEYQYFRENIDSYSLAEVWCSIENDYTKNIAITAAQGELPENTWIYNGFSVASHYQIDTECCESYSFGIFFDHTKGDIVDYLENSKLYIAGTEVVSCNSLDLILYDLKLFHPKYQIAVAYTP